MTSKMASFKDSVLIIIKRAIYSVFLSRGKIREIRKNKTGIQIQIDLSLLLILFIF